MKKLQLARNYIFTEAVLKQKADEMIGLLERDQLEFADRGFDAAAKSSFIEKRDMVDSLTSDRTLEAQKMVFTERKVAAKNALEKTMRTILNMAAIHFGERSAHFRAFGPTNLTRLREAELARVYKGMAAAATKNLVAMEGEGLRQILIDRLLQQGDAYDLALYEVADAIVARDIATEERILMQNDLYRLITKYAGIGKNIFYDTNEAKYNDYVIYDAQNGNQT